MHYSANSLKELIALALREDLEPLGDLTSEAIIPPDLMSRLVIRSRAAGGIMSGGNWVREVYNLLNPEIELNILVADGEPFSPHSTLIELSGPARALLMGERLALNLLQRAVSIATYTHSFVKLLIGTETKVLETRKTTPGLRMLEKQAVRDGGGLNHRYNLSTGILIKDNHIALLGSIKAAVLAAQKQQPYLTKLAVEVDSLEQLQELLELEGIDRVLLDNFSPQMVERAILTSKGKFTLEVSGGINLNNALDYARAGADYISLGCLTQSPPQIDLGLDIVD